MIVITTPTGRIGRRVLDLVLAAGEPVRVVVRDPDRLPASVRERVEVVPGSHGDARVVEEAFAGADAVFWVVPPNPRAAGLDAAYLDFSRPACEAFVRSGVGRVVGVSALGRGLPLNAGLVTASLAMDDLIAATGVHYRALTLPSFMDNLLDQAAVIRDQGVFFSPIHGDLKAPACATRDIAAAAAGLLLDRGWTGRADVPVLGPEDLSGEDMARIMAEVLGRPVGLRHVPMAAFRARLAEQGWSEAMAQGMADMMEAKNQGLDNAEPRTPQATTPTGFRQWCEEELRPAVLG
ncbi:NAD(P)H-binding protein [Nonomuraea sp. NPDC049684]|uniref:NAD(P)H-binding protein n=1 Tax=Nonomuraea sp. NPDC049684 TaxID=3364356 RepID=UPI0037A85FB7